MINKWVQELDSQGRLLLPREMRKLANISFEKELLLCSFGRRFIKLKKTKDQENKKIVGYAKVDEKGRMILPTTIRKNLSSTKIEIFVFNGDLIIGEYLGEGEKK